MPLKTYQEQELFFTPNFLEPASKAQSYAYRGELIIKEGDVADDSGRRKPPVSVLRDAILLSDDNKLSMMVGGLDDIADAEKLMQRYGSNIADGAPVILLAPNLACDCQSEIEGIRCELLRWDAMVWSQVSEEMRLEKSDFKGQSSAEKVETLYSEAVTYKPKNPFIPFNEVLATATESKRELHGAI
ncbi:hypothetical protein [Reinekea thalattae]|uniref:Uncharacterized protein n=1 Tax=Reinekea thalattae TaxID=2593301 RepID=A0A5C8Z716_9GAMM|nr:hypothetical protein [Reinekea thalattae]TXR53099.1 hypothetical protein FME95_00540 [Reinekea thalattae]